MGINCCFDRYLNRLLVRIRGYKISNPYPQPQPCWSDKLHCIFPIFFLLENLCLVNVWDREYGNAEVYHVPLWRIKVKNECASGRRSKFLSFDPGQGMFMNHCLTSIIQKYCLQSYLLKVLPSQVRSPRWKMTAFPYISDHIRPTHSTQPIQHQLL